MNREPKTIGTTEELCRSIVAGEGAARRRKRSSKWVLLGPLELEVAVARLEMLCGGAARASGGRPWRRKGAAVLG